MDNGIAYVLKYFNFKNITLKELYKKEIIAVQKIVKSWTITGTIRLASNLNLTLPTVQFI